MNRKYIVICSFFVAFFVLSLLCYGSFEYAKKQEQKKLAHQNAAQTSTKQEQRVTSETKLVIEKWQEESEELVKEERDMPPEYAGLTREELEKQLTIEIKDKSWEEEKEGLVKVHRESGVLEFTSVTFDQGSAQLNSNTEHLVEEMSKKLQVYLKEKPNLEILIEGHTDPSAVHNVVNIGGYYDSNIQLSALRAINVRNTLLRHVGAEYSGRIGVAGYGETRLKNKDNPMASENRRVEIRLLWSNTDNK